MPFRHCSARLAVRKPSWEVDRHVRTLLTGGAPDVGLVDVVLVASGRRPELGAAHVRVAGRGLFWSNGAAGQKELCFPWSSPLPIPNAHRSRRRWWVVLREYMVVIGGACLASAEEGEVFSPREGLW